MYRIARQQALPEASAAACSDCRAKDEAYTTLGKRAATRQYQHEVPEPLLGEKANTTMAVAAWLSGSALVLISGVSLRRTRLILGWVTVYR